MSGWTIRKEHGVNFAEAGSGPLIVLCHGGPIAMPPDANFILEQLDCVDGFYGASSMERLPTEKALTAQVQAFMKIRRS